MLITLYLGFHCDDTSCKPHGECKNNTCVCIQGYEGRECEINIDDCPSNECENGAICKDQLNGYDCECKPGFRGRFCKENIDDCESKPCLNGGTCMDDISNYTCECSPGYGDHQCQTECTYRKVTSINSCY